MTKEPSPLSQLDIEAVPGWLQRTVCLSLAIWHNRGRSQVTSSGQLHEFSEAPLKYIKKGKT